ncbi:hypothetical protein [Microcoleus sp.]|uniref:hypothetical protein n=1 Tax=Microcoleus sp. TaxID=44472 RepID=UPI003593B700
MPSIGDFSLILSEISIVPTQVGDWSSVISGVSLVISHWSSVISGVSLAVGATSSVKGWNHTKGRSSLDG